MVTVGVGTSGPVARRMAHLLSTSGTPSLFLHPGDALHGGLGAITAADVVLAISKGGGSAELNEFIRLAKTGAQHCWCYCEGGIAVGTGSGRGGGSSANAGLRSGRHHRDGVEPRGGGGAMRWQSS